MVVFTEKFPKLHVINKRTERDRKRHSEKHSVTLKFMCVTNGSGRTSATTESGQ